MTEDRTRRSDRTGKTRTALLENARETALTKQMLPCARPRSTKKN